MVLDPKMVAMGLTIADESAACEVASYCYSTKGDGWFELPPYHACSRDLKRALRYLKARGKLEAKRGRLVRVNL